MYMQWDYCNGCFIINVKLSQFYTCTCSEIIATAALLSMSNCLSFIHVHAVRLLQWLLYYQCQIVSVLYMYMQWDYCNGCFIINVKLSQFYTCTCSEIIAMAALLSMSNCLSFIHVHAVRLLQWLLYYQCQIVSVLYMYMQWDYCNGCFITNVKLSQFYTCTFNNLILFPSTASII